MRSSNITIDINSISLVKILTGVQTFSYGGSVNQVSTTDVTGNKRIERLNLNSFSSGLHRLLQTSVNLVSNEIGHT